MKKRIFMLLALLICICLSTGCSQQSRSFADMLREINALERYSAEATTTISIKSQTMSEALKQDGLPADMLETIEIKYKTNVDTSSMRMNIEFEVNAGGYSIPLNMYMDGTHIYVKVEDCIKLIETYSGDPELLAAFKDFVGDAEWIDLMTEEDLEVYEAVLDEATIKEYLAEYDRLLNAISKGYATFETKTFSAMSNSYKITLDNASLAGLISDFIEYTINNSEQIANAFIEYVNSSIFFTDEEKADFAQSMREMAEAATEVTNADIAYTKAFLADTFTNDECPFDFNLTYQLAKTSQAAYNQNWQFRLEVKDEDFGPVKISLNSQATIRENKSLEVKLPEMKTAKLEDLIETAEAHKGTPRDIEIRIYPEYEHMYYTKGYALPFLNESDYADVVCQTRNDYTYLPLRQISETAGIEANWDSAKGQPYVIVNEQPVYLNAFVDTAQGVTYIKIRDFEKIGFVVDYDPELNLISLTK